jgi:hypothetical protein
MPASHTLTHTLGLATLTAAVIMLLCLVLAYLGSS